MAKAKPTEVDNMREDIQSLKNNIMALSKRIEAEQRVNIADLKDKARENITHFQDYSKGQLANVEKEIKSHPAQSVALAFGAGLALSMLLRSKG